MQYSAALQHFAHMIGCRRCHFSCRMRACLTPVRCDPEMRGDGTSRCGGLPVENATRRVAAIDWVGMIRPSATCNTPICKIGGGSAPVATTGIGSGGDDQFAPHRCAADHKLRLPVGRKNYYGVLAPNAPLRQAVTAMVLAPAPPAPVANLPPAPPAPRRDTRYAWAQLLARIYEVFPLRCPLCATEMRIVGFITDPSTVRAILVHLGEPVRPPAIAPARGPPLWDLPDAAWDHFDPQAQPAPAYEFDQRVAW